MYDVILADAPWDFEVWNKDTGAGRSASAHYDTMTIKDICELPISKLANKNCALFFWGVWPRLFDCQTVISSWGFTYKTLAWVWVKQTKDQMKFATGMGYYTRANSEFCLLAVKGKMPVQAHDVLAVIASPRQAHSQKPDEQYLKIERLYPNMKYIELFARGRREGWDAFGNQVEDSVVLPVIDL
jgi:N6-adenosine-specific RNA methylase IME4